VILVRHGLARSKSRWPGSDHDRPLVGVGRAQGESLVHRLRHDEVTAIFSSPAVRCRQTVGPLAAARGLAVLDEPRLAKDVPPRDLLRWLRRPAQSGAVVCTHGEVFEALLELARGVGLVDLPASTQTEKGSAWRTTGCRDGVVGLDHLPPRPPR
jgi:broad specificity phosphatase PhoE